MIETSLNSLLQNFSISTVIKPSESYRELLQTYYVKRNNIRSRVQTNRLLTTDDLVKRIIEDIDWSQYSFSKITVIPATYKTTPISGEFFYHLAIQVENVLELIVEGSEIVDSSTGEASIVLKGSYYETDDGYQLVYKINDINKIFFKINVVTHHTYILQNML